MKKLLKISAFALFIAAGTLAFTSLSPSAAIAQDNQEEITPIQTQEEQPQEQPAPEQPSRYTYVAQPGDSYTKIARKAVQTFGYFENVNLSQAQIIAAETFLTSDAGFPSLNAGQEVKLSQDTIKAAVEKAQGLNDAAKARWERFVPFVNFDTNAVGQAQN